MESYEYDSENKQWSLLSAQCTKLNGIIDYKAYAFKKYTVLPALSVCKINNSYQTAFNKYLKLIIYKP